MRTRGGKGWVYVPGIPRSSLPEGPWIGHVHPTHFEVFRYQDELWYWRLFSATHDLVAESAQGYEKKEDCLAAIALVKSTTNDPIWDLNDFDPTQTPPFRRI